MSRRLQLNAGKTGLIWFGSRASLDKLSANELHLQAGVNTIHPATFVRDLRVLLDSSEVTVSKHVSKVASICFFQLRRLRQISSVVKSQHSWSLRSCSRDWTTATLF